MTGGARALAALVLAGLGCKSNDFHEAPHPDPVPAGRGPRASGVQEIAAPVDAARSAGPPPAVTRLYAEARAHFDATHAGLALMQLEASYVRSDGALDPTYGKLEVAFHAPRAAPKPPPADDPARPTGAPAPPIELDDDPIAELFDAKCPHASWAAGAWEWTAQGGCRTPRLDPRCALEEVWQRAITLGAPRDALAVIALHDEDGDASPGAHWSFTIRDAPRDISVYFDIPDTCAVAVEAGPKGAPPAPLGELDVDAVATAIRGVRPALARCGEAGKRAHVELAVHVTKSGAVDRATVVAAPDTPTGRCAASAVRAARFPPSASGLETTIPLEL